MLGRVELGWRRGRRGVVKWCPSNIARGRDLAPERHRPAVSASEKKEKGSEGPRPNGRSNSEEFLGVSKTVHVDRGKMYNI